MKQYANLMQHILDHGTRQSNRTGIDTLFVPGAMMQFDMADGFPALTLKKLPFKACVGELIGFLQAKESAADFRKLGCNVWDQNANENEAWLNNPNRKGKDDLGRIYGAQWRHWVGGLSSYDDSAEPEDKRSQFRLRAGDGKEYGLYAYDIDQVLQALETIRDDPTNRRIIINAWNPGEFPFMALPPCHVMYQFIVNTTKQELNLCMYQRSCDMFLGVPFNIAESALMLHLFAHLTGLRPRIFTHFLADAHIYVNHIEQTKEMLKRESLPLPELEISIPSMGMVDDAQLIESLTPECFNLINYQSHAAIKALMAV